MTEPAVRVVDAGRFAPRMGKGIAQTMITYSPYSRHLCNPIVHYTQYCFDCRTV